MRKPGSWKLRGGAGGGLRLLLALGMLASCGDSATSPARRDGGADAGAPPKPVPAALSANAGRDQLVWPGAEVTLDAGGSISTAGRNLTYLWSQISGPTVTLSDPAARTARFRAPEDGARYAFLVTVGDGELQSSDHLDVIVRSGAAGSAPFPVAGPDAEVRPGERIDLDGSASWDADGEALTFAWRTVIDGVAGPVLADTPRAHYTAPEEPGLIILRLDVSDGFLGAHDDLVLRITDEPTGNRAPRAWADVPDQVEPGAEVSLVGSAEDPEDDAIHLSWRQIGGPSVALSKAAFSAPYRVVDLAFVLGANDGVLAAAPVAVRISVTAGAGNEAPVARPGPDQTVAPGDEVTLDGQGSVDPDGDPLAAFAWLQLGGPGAALTDPEAATTRLVAPAQTGTLTFALSVFDGRVWSAPALVRVHVAAP